MPKISFTKMHGCGNDYIYVNATECPIANPSETSVFLSNRHKGIGSDGLVLIEKSPMSEADFSMRIFNADGSEAMMCGNASRCIAKYVYERGLTDKTEIRLLTLSGIKTLLLHITDGKVMKVTVDMGEPMLENSRQFVDSRGLTNGTFVSMGNPHYVIFTDQVDQVFETGPRLENHAAFPERCNIEFARVENPNQIRVRVWERGSGVTQACGTGACATAVAACLTNRSGHKTQILMDGGDLEIEWCQKDSTEEKQFFKKNHVYMTGPAEFIFDGEIDI